VSELFTRHPTPRARPAATSRSRTAWTSGALAALVSASALGCPAKNEEPAVARGRAVYQSVCTACHAPDPALAGAVGPALRGSSRALLEAKVLHGAYPAGYAPKRDTNAMPTQPQVAGSLDDLAAYLR